jgi:hypothetical protein
LNGVFKEEWEPGLQGGEMPEVFNLWHKLGRLGAVNWKLCQET